MNALPSIEAFASADSICNGESIIFSSTGAPILEWETADVENDIAYFPIVEGEQLYTVVGTDENGCQNEAAVTVNMAAPIVVTYTVTDEIFGSDASIDIEVTGGFGSYVYDWNNDELGDYDDTQDLADLDAGSYIVTVQDEFGCEGVETIEINSQVSLTEHSNVNVSVYPNPGKDQLTINLAGSFDYSLVNVSGEIIASGKGFNAAKLAVGDLAMGIYFIQISSTDGTVQTVKITKL